MNWLLLVSLILSPVFLSIAARRRLEEAIAPFFGALLLVLYGLSVFQLLPLMNLIAPVMASVLAMCAVVRMARKGFGRGLKQAAGLIFTPGMLCFALAAAFLLLCSRDHVVHSTDDIYYWGIQPRSLYAHGGLVDAVQHLSPRFMTYTPGMQLWQWLGLEVMGEWNEAYLYAVLWMSYLMFFVPLTSGITWRRAYWAPLMLILMICVPTLMNVDAYDMLRVDTALGLCMGYAMVQAYRLWRRENGGRWELACFGLALCTLVLLKQIGIAWAVMAMVFVWLVWKPQQGMKRWHLALTCVFPLLVYGSWQLVCDKLQLSGIHLSSASGQMSQILSGTWQAPEWLKDLPAALLAAITSDLHNGLPMLGWLVLLITVLWILSSREKKRGAMMGWCIGASVLFVAAYSAILVLSIFGEDASSMTDVNFMSMLTQRYGCPLPAGLFMLCAAWLLDTSRPASLQRRVMVGVLAVLVLCFTRWPSMYKNFDPEVYAEDTAELVYETEMTENFWIDELEDVEDAVVLYVTAYPPYITERLQYAAAPHKIVVAPTYEIDEAAFVRMLEDNRISHIVCMDDLTSAYSHAVNYTEDGWLDVWSVYNVYHEDGEWLIAY